MTRGVAEAVLFGSRDALLDAIANGADVNERSDGVPALVMACIQERADLAEDLIRHGAAVDAATPDSMTALHFAAGVPGDALVRTLIQASASIHAKNSIGQTPLMIAAQAGNAMAITACMEAGADPSAADECGRTALHWAAAGGDFPDVTMSLLRAGVDAGARNRNGESAREYASALGRVAMVGVLRVYR
jgi:uncharacterized protein